MRIIKNFEDEALARRFSLYLQSIGIDNTLDVKIDTDSQKFTYQVWIHDEDKIDEAKLHLEQFEKKSDDRKFDVSIKETVEEKDEIEDFPKVEQQEMKKKFQFKLTGFLLILCVFIYLLNFYQEVKIKSKDPKISYVLLTPVQTLLLFDVPYVLIKVDQVIQKYNINPTKDIQKQSPAAYRELAEIDKMPFWRGVYEMVIMKKKNPSYHFQIKGTLFEKISKGQLWRLISPCVLHKDFLHLLFNMLWLFLLGKQIEKRLSLLKYILLILVAGIISNTAQYLMSGPYFLGFSGVITAMVGFIYSRQKKAPWEGYPLQKVIFLFLGVYVILMFVLSFFSFITEIVGMNLFTPNIANTAHIVGALVGFLLGRLNFFSWEAKHEH